MRWTKTLLLFSIAAIFACKQDLPEVVQRPYFIFGTYSDVCNGDCTVLYLLQDGKLYVDQVDRGLPETLSFNVTPLPDSLYSVAVQVREQFPDTLAMSDERIYGCPDCADQGGVLVETFNGENDPMRYQLDRDSEALPAALVPYKELVESVTNSLQN